MVFGISEAFRRGGENLRAVIIKNHGVVAFGNNIHLGGPKYILDNST
jgi:ribulose-5-phosphate 4-epimerase/fuculose-1-phosphate aldolase